MQLGSGVIAHSRNTLQRRKSTPLRLGIIGVGKHGSRYAKHAALDVDEIDLVTVCRRNESAGRRLAETYGCEYVADPWRLIARRDIDAIVLATVPDLLGELLPAALRAGKRVLVEKPVAINAQVGGKILRIVERERAYCMAAHTLRFNTVCKAIREQIGTLGRIDSLVFSQRFPPQLELGWLDDPERSGGGNILHTGVHCFDLIHHLADLTPASVFCVARRLYTRRTEDHFVATLTFPHAETLAVVTCSRTTQSRNGLIEISGEHGQLVGDHVQHRLWRLGPGGREELPLGPPCHTVLEVLRQLVRDAATDAPPTVPYRDGLMAVLVADACYRSLRSGRVEPVVLPESRP